MHVGAIIRYPNLSDCEARIVANGDRAIISVDSKKHPLRQRFSIGHELGHWCFHRGRNFICRPDDIGNPSKSITDPERVADQYAADLLMPRYLFAPASQRLRTNFRFTRQLAVSFQCSLTSTAIRMAEHGPEPSILICHAPHGRKWFVRNRDVPEKWFPSKRLDRESHASEVQAGRGEEARRELVYASLWFDRDEADRYEVYEETIRTKNGETLTFITFKNDGMLNE